MGYLRTVLLPVLGRHNQVESALRTLPGLAAVTVVRSDPKGMSYYPADHAANLWYASSQLSKSMTVQTFDWDVTLEGLAGPQPLLQVSPCFTGKTCVWRSIALLDQHKLRRFWRRSLSTWKISYTNVAKGGVLRRKRSICTFPYVTLEC